METSLRIAVTLLLTLSVLQVALQQSTAQASISRGWNRDNRVNEGDQRAEGNLLENDSSVTEAGSGIASGSMAISEEDEISGDGTTNGTGSGQSNTIETEEQTNNTTTTNPISTTTQTSDDTSSSTPSSLPKKPKTTSSSKHHRKHTTPPINTSTSPTNTATPPTNATTPPTDATTPPTNATTPPTDATTPPTNATTPPTDATTPPTNTTTQQQPTPKPTEAKTSDGTTSAMNEASATPTSVAPATSNATDGEQSAVPDTQQIGNKTGTGGASGSDAELDGVTSRRGTGPWLGILAAAAVMTVLGVVVYVALKKRREKDFSHRKLVEVFPSDPVLRLDNSEPLDLNFGGGAYYNPALQGDNIQMSNYPGRQRK